MEERRGDTGQEYQLPNDWTIYDLRDAAEEMNAFIKTSKAFQLMAHRMGCDQRIMASKAMPVLADKYSAEAKAQAAGAYYCYERMFSLMDEIRSYRPPQEEGEE